MQEKVQLLAEVPDAIGFYPRWRVTLEAVLRVWALRFQRGA